MHDQLESESTSPLLLKLSFDLVDFRSLNSKPEFAVVSSRQPKAGQSTTPSPSPQTGLLDAKRPFSNP